MAFFCASSNTWGTSTCPITPPKPVPGGAYPIFDPTTNSWISSGAYGSGTPTVYPYFCNSTNQWITAGKCP